MEVDVLDYVTGGVLSMKCKDRKQRPVVSLSKSLNEIERNYEIHDKKMLVVIRELENQRHLLESAKLKFKVWTDYKNLEYFMKVQKLNIKQACQALYLLRFDFILKHVLGTKIEKVYRLSKRLGQKVEVEKDNENQTLIKEQWICSLAEVVIEGPEVDILEKIKISRKKNKEVVRVIEEMKKAEVKVLWGDEWQIERDLVLKERKVYVMKSETLMSDM